MTVPETNQNDVKQENDVNELEKAMRSGGESVQSQENEVDSTQLKDLQKSVEELRKENENLKSKISNEPPLTSLELAKVLREAQVEQTQPEVDLDDMSQAELVAYMEQKFAKKLEQVTAASESKVASVKKEMQSEVELRRQYDSDIETEVLAYFPEGARYVDKIKAVKGYEN